MIDLYFAPTPNGWKPAILLEELGVPYTVKLMALTKGEQFTPEFLAINPNAKMPAIVDHEADGGPLSVWESATILMYLARKYDRFWPQGNWRFDLPKVARRSSQSSTRTRREPTLKNTKVEQR